jgi:hypothetical protein
MEERLSNEVRVVQEKSGMSQIIATVRETAARLESSAVHPDCGVSRLAESREEFRQTGPRVRAQAIWGSNDAVDRPANGQSSRLDAAGE